MSTMRTSSVSSLKGPNFLGHACGPRIQLHAATRCRTNCIPFLRKPKGTCEAEARKGTQITTSAASSSLNPESSNDSKEETEIRPGVYQGEEHECKPESAQAGLGEKRRISHLDP
jgi:hypothetical protein